MKTISINKFYGGMADDRFHSQSGQFSFAKHFDILSHPSRLQPVRGMTTHTASTGIGNIILGSSGYMYGSGTTGATGKLFYLPGFGGSDDWSAFSTNQVSGNTANYELLVDYPDAGNAKTLFWASANLLVASPSDPASGSAVSTQALTFATIGQGFVHPKDKILYIPYRTTTASYIATIGANATPFGTYSATAFTLPSQYRVYCLTNYGDYLAIPATTSAANGAVPNASIVYLSDRDTSLSTFAASIPWGTGNLKVLNNLQGVLVGVSEVGTSSGTAQDMASIQIKIYEGGAEPRLIKEIKAIHLTATSTPTVTINARVNFVKDNRLYFAANILPGDSIQPSYYGLWSVGRDKLTGQWTVVEERVATNTNTDTGVLAAAAAGDYFELVHTAEGTLTKSTNGVTSASTYGATSVYESLVNPEMSAFDYFEKKKLYSFTVHYLPLPSGASVTAYVRVDSNGATTEWVSLGSNISSETVAMERMKTAASAFFTDGRHFEFKLESTGGAVITGFTYKYDVLPTNQ